MWRDQAILWGLHIARVMSTLQVAVELFPGRQACKARERLHRLRGMGLVERYRGGRRTGSEPLLNRRNSSLRRRTKRRHQVFVTRSAAIQSSGRARRRGSTHPAAAPPHCDTPVVAVWWPLQRLLELVCLRAGLEQGEQARFDCLWEWCSAGGEEHDLRGAYAEEGSACVYVFVAFVPCFARPLS